MIVESHARARRRAGAPFARRLPRALGGAALSVRGLDALSDAGAAGRAAIVINATSMGLTTGASRDSITLNRRACFFYDLIYAGEPTAFLRPAIALGRRAADGAGMLVNQGELAFELFNGVAPPRGRDAPRALGARWAAMMVNRPAN